MTYPKTLAMSSVFFLHLFCFDLLTPLAAAWYNIYAGAPKMAGRRQFYHIGWQAVNMSNVFICDWPVTNSLQINWLFALLMSYNYFIETKRDTAMITFFDVDQTLIDSDARYHAAVAAGNGTFNVAFYRENQTDAMLAADKPLPLLDVVRASGMLARGYILTAREMLPADFRQFQNLGLDCLDVFHRGNAPANIASIQHNGDYKKAYINFLRLTRFADIPENEKGYWAVIYDDDIGVLKMAPTIGVSPKNAIIINQMLAEVA